MAERFDKVLYNRLWGSFSKALVLTNGNVHLLFGVVNVHTLTLSNNFVRTMPWFWLSLSSSGYTVTCFLSTTPFRKGALYDRAGELYIGWKTFLEHLSRRTKAFAEASVLFDAMDLFKKVPYFFFLKWHQTFLRKLVTFSMHFILLLQAFRKASERNFVPELTRKLPRA